MFIGNTLYFVSFRSSREVKVWKCDTLILMILGLEVELGKIFDKYFILWSPNLHLGVENTLYFTEFWRFEAISSKVFIVNCSNRAKVKENRKKLRGVSGFWRIFQHKGSKHPVCYDKFQLKSYGNTWLLHQFDFLW